MEWVLIKFCDMYQFLHVYLCAPVGLTVPAALLVGLIVWSGRCGSCPKK